MESEFSTANTLPARESASIRVNVELPELEGPAVPPRPGPLLGEGGMGEVRLCTDVRLGRQLAMKTSHATDPAARARFLREARIQGQLEHPGIVPVHELGLDPGGRPYFTMKRVRGVTFAEALEGSRRGDPVLSEQFPRRRLLSAVHALGQTIDFAHARGVVHRDLKPANVMLGDFGEVYVLDWGLARVMRAGSEQDAPAQSPAAEGLTQLGAVLGTPGYMSPEQAAGAPATGASDVWALGAMLFEVLTASPLIQARDPHAALAETQRPVDSPQRRAPGRDIAPELDQLCLEATALLPAQRPTARVFSARLEAILAGEHDLALRHSLAAHHASLAAAGAEQALAAAGDAALAARRQALGHVGRALALDTANAQASEVFLRILAQPPAVPPPEVLEAVSEGDEAARRLGARNMLAGQLIQLGMLGLFVLVGVRRYDLVAAFLVPWAVAVASSTMLLRKEAQPRALMLTALGSMMVLSVLQGAIAGPLLILPAVSTVNLVAALRWTARRDRGLVIGGSLLTAVVPCLFMAARAWPVTYQSVAQGAALQIESQLVDLGRPLVLFYLLGSTLMTILAGAFGALAARDELRRAQLELAQQRWNLEQLRPR